VADVDLDAGTLLVMRSRLRPRWKHGCIRPCGRKFGGHCPERVALREETADITVPALNAFYVHLLENGRVKEDGNGKMYEYWRDHQSRRNGHTYSTLSLDTGIEPKILSDRVGHSNPAVTFQIYAHCSTGQDRAAAELIGRLIERAVTGPKDPAPEAR
jgi:integrase